MAYNIKPLRQQNLFDSFGLAGLGDLSGNDPGYSYDTEDQQDPDPTNRSVYQSSIPSPSSTRVSSADIAALKGPNVNISSAYDRSRNDDEDLKKMIDSIYSPSTADRDRYRSLLDNTPQREEPSFGRRLVGFGVGLGNKGMGVAPSIENEEKVLYAPYLRDMAEWSAKVAPYQQAASLENTANINERTLAGNIVNAQTQGRRIDESERAARAREDENSRKNRETAEIGRRRNEIIDAKNNGAKFYTKGEDIIGMLPDGTTWDTGTKTTNFDPYELARLNITSREKITAENNAAAMARTVQAGQNAVTTKSTPTAGVKFKAGDENKIRQEVLQRYKDTDQDAARWIKNGPNGLDLGPRPVVGGGKVAGLFGTAYTQADVDSYDRVARAAHPNTVNQDNVGGNVGGGGDLHQKAADFLKQNGKIVSEANIQHAIQMGWVK